nr:phage tail domain-containing protein [Ligilactobacillus apodemi]
MYEERTLEFEFIIARANAMTIEELEYKKSQIANWLEPGIRHRLSYSEIPFYYFLAEAQGDYDYTEESGYALLKVKFVCLPYKIHEVDESDDIWDTFEFENDIAQDLTFEVAGDREVKIYNAGTARVSPKLIVTGNITVGLNELSEDLKTGTYDQTKIVLSRGWNKAKLAGSGTIRFSFSKEVL